MEEWRRRAYLSAMGVSLWERRESVGLGSVLAAAPSVDDGRAADVAAEPEGAAGCARAEPVVQTAPSAVQTAAAEGAALATPADVLDEPATRVARMDWEALERTVAGCRACELCQSRTQSVFGVGNRSAALMVIGEAPGVDEDRQGEPFVGRAGQLLTRMLGAIGLAREDVYIANVLKCRPPGNRDPKPEEALQCQGYLLRQLALIRPAVVLSVGRISAQLLLRTDESVGRLRGRWLDYGEDAIPLRVTYHPAYLLRSPDQKAKAWQDLTEVRRRLDALAANSGATARRG